MKLSEIEKSNPVLTLVDRARERLGEDALYGGNCGMFAMAIAKKLKEQGVSVTLGIVFRDNDDIQNPSDITDSESDVYHMVVEHDGNYYDGTGKVTADTLLDIAKDQYGDDRPGFFTDVDPNDPMVARLIRNDTNWNTNSSEFYHAFSENSDIEKIDEIDLEPRIGKGGLSSASDLDHYYSRTKDSAIAQQALYSDKKYNVVLTKSRFMGNGIQVFLVDTSNKDRVAARMSLKKYKKHGYQVIETKVRPAYQGQGLALKTYKSLIKDFDIILVSGPVQSLGGANLWASLYKTSGITVYGHNPRDKQNEFFDVDIDASGKLDTLSGRDLYRPFIKTRDYDVIRLIATKK